MIGRHTMTMRAVIERDVSVTRDAFGGEVPPSWQHDRVVPCRAWYDARRAHQDKQRDAHELALTCILPAGTAVNERQERVARIEDRRARIVFPGPFSFAQPMVRRDGHVEAVLERVT